MATVCSAIGMWRGVDCAIPVAEDSQALWLSGAVATKLFVSKESRNRDFASKLTQSLGMVQEMHQWIWPQIDPPHYTILSINNRAFQQRLEHGGAGRPLNE